MKRIDRLVLSAGCAAGYYYFFLNAWRSVPLAVLAAYACCLLTRGAVRGLPRVRRASRAQAAAELLRIASLPDHEAEAVLDALLRRRYPGEAFTLATVLKHPEASLTCGDVLAAWKANRGAERLAIAATCPCEARALLYARELRAPRVAVADSRVLERILRRGGMPAPDSPPRSSLKARLRRAVGSACATRFSPRNLLLAAALLALYWVQGAPLNLFAALALLAHQGIALGHGRVERRRLFDCTE